MEEETFYCTQVMTTMKDDSDGLIERCLSSYLSKGSFFLFHKLSLQIVFMVFSMTLSISICCLSSMMVDFIESVR